MTSKIERKPQITIETHSITVSRTKDAPLAVFCVVCQKQVSAFDSVYVANALQPIKTEIELMCGAGEVHAVNPDDLQICSNSLAELFSNKNREEK